MAALNNAPDKGADCDQSAPFVMKKNQVLQRFFYVPEIVKIARGVIRKKLYVVVRARLLPL